MSGDNTIRVWNATTGETVAGPFTGHTDSISSVAFLPNGQHIVSGSDDNTIRAWNAMTGETVAGPFAGYMPSVPPSIPSPDRQVVASGSCDCMIRLVKNMFGVTERTILSDSMDQSMIDHDGWICGDEGALVFWIPLIHRSSLYRPANIWIAGPHETQLDLSRFVHGLNWATCKDD